MQGASEPTSRILTQVGIEVALKPHHTLSSLCCKPKDAINWNKSMVWCIKFLAGIAMLCMWLKQDVVLEPENGSSQHVMDFDHRIDWDNVKILKSESHAYRRRVAESFLINQKACSCNVINRNDGANFPAVYSVFVSNTCT